jgi:hypothetical protein
MSSSSKILLSLSSIYRLAFKLWALLLGPILIFPPLSLVAAPTQPHRIKNLPTATNCIGKDGKVDETCRALSGDVLDQPQAITAGCDNDAKKFCTSLKPNEMQVNSCLQRIPVNKLSPTCKRNLGR